MGKSLRTGTGPAIATLMSLGLCGGWGAAPSAAAQEAVPTAAPEADRVVVTGSFLSGTPENAALPVDVIDALSLEEQGSPSMVQLVKTITPALSSVGESNRFLGTAAGVATVNLRGFGSSRTLVLMNSLRMANSAAAIGAGAADVNFVPQTALARVEVLRDGAAATYGSDAVGGVVNFITRRDLDGLELSTSYASISDSDGDYDVGLTWGWRGERGNVLLTGSYRRRSELHTTDRDWALRPFAENNFGGYSSASNPGVYITGTPGAFTTSFADNGCAPLGGTAVPGACLFQFTQFDNLVNDEFHYNIFGEVNFDLTDNVEFHAEALWGRHDVPDERVSPSQSTANFPAPVSASGASPGGGVSPYPAVGGAEFSRYYIPPTNPGLAAYLAANCPAQAFCTNALANGVNASPTGWRPLGWGGNPLFPDGANRQSRQADAFRFVGGFAGDFENDTHWNLNAVYSEVRQAEATPDMFINRVQLALRGYGSLLGGDECTAAETANFTTNAGNTSLGCYYFNPFSNGVPRNAVTGAPNTFNFNAALANNPALISWMQGDLQFDRTSQLFTVESIFDGEAPLELPGGPIAWALGGQWRYERFVNGVDRLTDIQAAPCPDSLPIGDGVPTCSRSQGSGVWTFYNGVEEYDIDRSVTALFGEIRFPLLSTLELTAAVRYEDYKGTVGSTTNPKFSVRWEMMDWLAFRASAGSTFRAPPQTAVTPGFNARILAQIRNPITTLSLYRPIDVLANPGLRPETADNYNVGVIVEPGNFRSTVDYWHFDFTDVLTAEVGSQMSAALFPSATVNNCTTPGYAGLVSRFNFGGLACSPNNLLGITTYQINGAGIETSGVDFSAQYDFDDVLGGTLTIGADGTYLIEYIRGGSTVEGIQVAATRDIAGTQELLALFESFPHWRANAFVNLNRGSHNLRWDVRYVQGTEDRNVPGFRSDDFVQHNLTYRVELPSDTLLTLSVQNLFDEEPPFARSQYNYDYTQGNPLGRVFEIGLRQRF